MKTKLNWNEEYWLSFENVKGLKFSTSTGRGFFSKASVDDEVKRLKSLGFKKIKVLVRVWNVF